MQQSSIELKSTKYALTLVMDPAADFATILIDVREKFRKGERFFRGASMALEFSGRELSASQMQAAVRVIQDSCALEITCILERDEEKEKAQYEAISRASLAKLAGSEASGGEAEKDRGSLPPQGEEALIVRGSVRNGQRVCSDKTILLLGDVEPGGEVASEGSVFVAGVAMGTLRSGISGRMDTFAAAMVLKPSALEVGGHRSVSAIRKRTMDDSYTLYPQVCTVEDGHMKLETVSGRTWKHIFDKLAQEALRQKSAPGGEEDACSASTD